MIMKFLFSTVSRNPQENFYLFYLLKQYNPALFKNSTVSPHLIKKTLPIVLRSVNNLDNFFKPAFDHLLTSKRDIAEISLIVQKYRQLLYNDPQECYLHKEFILTVENEAVRFLQKFPDYTASEDGLRTSLLLAIELFKIFPPYPRRYLESLLNNLPHTIRKEDFLTLLFTINMYNRKLSPTVQNWIIKHSLYFIDSMSVDEICFLTSALNKSQTRIDCKSILDEIVAKTTKSLSQLDSFSFSLIVKGLRFIIPKPLYAFIIALWKHLDGQDQRTVSNCVHLNNYAVDKLCYLEELTERLLVAVSENYVFFLPKDVERVIKHAAHYEHGKPEYNLVKKIVDQIQNDEVFLDLLDQLIPLTRSLCALNIHIPKIFNRVLSTNWQRIYYSSDKSMFEKIGLVNLMLIRDYCMIEQYPKYRYRLSNLDKMYKIFKKDSNMRMPLDWFSNFDKQRFMEKSDKDYIKTFLDLTKNIERKYPHMHLWRGYLVDSATKPSLVMYKNPNHGMILKSHRREPHSLKGCISIEITRMSQYNKRDGTGLKPGTRIRRKMIENLGIKVIELPYYYINWQQPDPFKFVDQQIYSIKN